MKKGSHIPLVTTIREQCRMCYTCVRECPAKAIKIVEGQAQVVSERCIACGNCVRVCTQDAKRMLDSTVEVAVMLGAPGVTAALVAPSFPAEFTDCTPGQFVGMLRRLGFDHVHEVSFGADLVADRYRKLLDTPDGKRYIATSCPAIVAYVERYHPGLVPNLAPIVSPMVAAARALRADHGADVRMVFIGPCIAKKGEMVSDRLDREVDTGLTFIELRQLFNDNGIRPDEAEPSDFDPPHGGPGALFPLSRGMLQAAHIEEDLIDGRVVAADGRSEFVEAIREFEEGHLEAKLLEVLACNGCINGPGIANDNSLFARRNGVSRFVRDRMSRFDWHQWRKNLDRFRDLDLARTYEADDQRIPCPSEVEIRDIMDRMGKQGPEDELNCGACGYDTCREHAIAVFKGLAESEMCLPNTIDELRRALRNLAVSEDELDQTREALSHAERLASMGQLAAGIAHELNNPLGVVLMYSHLIKEDHEADPALMEDLNTITDQADRCKKIVAGLLHFARQNKVDRSPTSVNDLLRRMQKACPPPEGVSVEVVAAHDEDTVSLDRDQMLQVLTNLAGNAHGAMPDGGKLTIRTSDTPSQLKISFSDTGIGISKANRDKIFEPFFTTKEVGKGTGLGLAVTYGIVKMHRGNISVDSNDDPEAGPTGTTFTISIPK
jgi:signal transduction histidine kinase/iron only hydrogenase large subunit-like protein